MATTQRAVTYTSKIKGKNLEEIIADWNAQLEENVQAFTAQAVKVQQWDERLIQNANKITKLHNDVKSVEFAQKELDHHLEYIHAQQTDLNKVLENLEAEIELAGRTGDSLPVDEEREGAYEMARSIDVQLMSMSVTLQEMLKQLGAEQSRYEKDDNPVSQIVKILNEHLNSLQWIDSSASTLQRKIEDLSNTARNRNSEMRRRYEDQYY